MMGVLTLATVLLFVFLRTELSLTGVEAAALLGAYLLFVAWVVAETIGATDVIRGV
jgi:cation:H+ antiporter